MKDQIKQLRVEIDGLHQLTLNLKPVYVYKITYDDVGRKIKSKTKYCNNSNEIKQAAEKLMLAKAWLGKVLGELGEETPYKNDGNRKTREDIEPAADIAETVYGAVSLNDSKSSRLEAIDTFTLNGRVMYDYTNLTHIEKVDWLREEIKAVIQRLSNIFNYNEFGVSNGELSTIYLQEARFWLGFELGRVRDESK